MARRIHVAGGSILGSLFRGGNKFRVLKQTLGATLTMDADMPHVVILDPDGSGRTVLLPPEESGLFFFIGNAEDVSGDLTVKEDAGSTTIAPVAPGDIQLFFCDGTTWYATSLDTASITTLAVTTFSATTATIANTGLRLLDTGGDHYTTIKQNSDEAANRIAKIPALGADDTFGMIGQAQTWAAIQTFGVMFKIPTATVAATGSVQGDAAALATGFSLVSAADGTKGVVLPTAVAGAVAIVKNNANAVLKLYPASSDAINALSADAALSMAAYTTAVLVAYDATTWYTIPLLPS